MPTRITKWDYRFLEMAQLVSGWSKDPSTKCGAVIVRPDLTIASLGYNGFPKGCNDYYKLYNDRELKYSRVIHAEANAILHARETLEGYSIYTWPFLTCDRCSTLVIQSGIKRVISIKDAPERWQDAINRAKDMYTESGVHCYTYNLEDYVNKREPSY